MKHRKTFKKRMWNGYPIKLFNTDWRSVIVQLSQTQLGYNTSIHRHYTQESIGLFYNSNWYKALKREGVMIFLILNLFILTAGAQQAIPATGGNISGNEGSVSFSAGQLVYTTMGTSGTAAQGVQQPYEISVVSGNEKARGIYLLGAAVYPNPTTEHLTLTLNNYGISSSLSYALYTMNGAIIGQKKIESNQTNIAFNQLTAGLYFLKVIEGNQEIKTFKIIKR